MKNNILLARKPGCCGHLLTSADNDEKDQSDQNSQHFTPSCM